MQTPTPNTIKVRVTWSSKIPNVIQAPYQFSYELTDKTKLELIERSDLDIRTFFINLWSVQIIKQQHPEHCKLYEPTIIKTEII